MERQEYGFIPNLDKITAGEWVDIENNQNEKKNMWKIMSVLYRPIIEEAPYGHYEIAEYDGEFREEFKQMPMNIVLGAHLFFCDLGIDLLSYTLNCLAPEKSEKQKRTKALDGDLKQAFKRLIKNGDGQVGYSDYVITMLQDLKQYRNSLYIKL